ncbi:Arginine/ornithine antiporter ArcD [[Actinomadura] parvosata subsp. kistnae]|uniref:DoxX family protein n=1 Tax=[Actinomadura] parvosata subsp. kistnae TaxID=1909395 RepID=A0A1V0AI31_9ACTN|nr:hypothetical protein [Nonomuraea sp. ATCC 55076]AQZ69866.1 hypothetical protein BKM31_57965 [Nonomuraea sp. ATCC 55076]SPL90178.1 Arginine/ornithine antiporter ArcD [Actinomadura parvosata subsp. kistnae]
MKIFARPHQLPPRVSAAAIILNSGLDLIHADEQRAAATHGMAAGAYPFLRRMDPALFTRLLARSQVALGAALLAPFVPSLVAGAALTGFAAGLVGLYLRTPGMREEGSLRPTPQGLGVAKDVWLLGIGLGLVAEELRDRQLPGRQH